MSTLKKKKEQEIESLHYMIPKSQLKCVKDLNTRLEIVKPLEESIGEIGFSNDFLDMATRA